jgi:hypothetical protein
MATVNATGLAEYLPLANALAIIIASATAATVAWRLGRLQATLAKRQTDIAREKLKLDLFDRRYAKFLEAKDLLKYMANLGDWNAVDQTRIITWYISLEEAKFFFDHDVQAFLTDLTDHVEVFLMHLAARKNIGDGETELWKTTAEQLAKESTYFRTSYGELIKVFKKALSFEHLIAQERDATAEE